MVYGSVCSGIEAATVAWEPLGFKPAFFAEIDPFCNALLAHHYPSVKNYGDFTTIPAGSHKLDILVGGTPCQAFSVAGKRGGLDDAHGNLTLEFLRLAERLRPTWLVWENVPGVLSIDGGRTFGTVLGQMAQLGYGVAYRILDAQHFGVPQRRRRIFVVGHLGDWRRAAAVLFERHSLSGHPPPSRKTREEVAGTLGGGSGNQGWRADTDRMTFIIPRVSRCLKGKAGTYFDVEMETYIPVSVARVRRLTPRECERLQGFPDDWTLIPYRKKLAKDSPRYRAIGNSMAVPVMDWVGSRIKTVSEIPNQ